MCEFSDLRNLHAFSPSTSLKIWISASCSYAKICLFLVKLSSYFTCACRVMALDVVDWEFGRIAGNALRNREAAPAPVLQFKVGIFGYMYLES